MAQIWQQNSALRSRYAQPTLMPTVQAVNTRVACEQLEQMARRLEAAQAEIRRYQTRLFACERQMIALRRENAELEAAGEQAARRQSRPPPASRRFCSSCRLPSRKRPSPRRRRYFPHRRH